MPKTTDRVTDEPLEPLILSVRDQRVILDMDLARLYGVSTRALNQAVRRNAERFPADFAFPLSSNELTNLKSQIVTSSSHGGRRKRPWVFSEHGANVLRSTRAVQMSIFVTRAFVRLREHLAADAAIHKRLAEIDKTLLQHDAALRDVYRRLLPLLAPPAPQPKPRIGF